MPRKPRAENRWIEKYKVQGEHGLYTVSLAKDGTWGCSCPRWRFKREECKHITILQEVKRKLSTEPRRIEVAFGPRPEMVPPAFEVTVGGFHLVEKIVDAPFHTWHLLYEWWSTGLLWECPPFHANAEDKTLIRAVW